MLRKGVTVVAACFVSACALTRFTVEEGSGPDAGDDVRVPDASLEGSGDATRDEPTANETSSTDRSPGDAPFYDSSPEAPADAPGARALRCHARVTDVTALTGESVSSEVRRFDHLGAGDIPYHELAAPNDKGDLILFTQRASDPWTTLNLSQTAGFRPLEPPWPIDTHIATRVHIFPDSLTMRFKFAAPNPKGELLIFDWEPGASARIDATAAVNGFRPLTNAVDGVYPSAGGSGDPGLWTTSEDGHIYQFTFWGPPSGFGTTDGWHSSAINVVDNVAGTPSVWKLLDQWHVAVAIKQGDLVVLNGSTQAPTVWTTENLSQITGKRLAASPAGWESNGTNIVAGVTAEGALLGFVRGAPGAWSVTDLTAEAGVSVRGTPAHHPGSTVGTVFQSQIFVARTSANALAVFRFDPGAGRWGSCVIDESMDRLRDVDPYTGIYDTIATVGIDGHLLLFDDIANATADD
jgi:hypothetical protein